jgi:hypothetical protein
MKRIAYFGVILVLLAASAVPVLAKTPGNNNGNPGNGGKVVTPTVPQGTQQHAELQVQDQNQAQGNPHSQNDNHNQFKETNGHGKDNHGQSSRMRTPFYLQGTITAVDSLTQVITVKLTHGNAQVKASIGMTLTLQAGENTQIFRIIQGNDDNQSGTSTGINTSTEENNDEQEVGNRLPITFDELAVNDIVAIHGNLVDGVYQVTLITVYVPMSMGAPMGIQP